MEQRCGIEKRHPLDSGQWSPEDQWSAERENVNNGALHGYSESEIFNPSSDGYPTLADIDEWNEESDQESILDSAQATATWRCVGGGDPSGELLWVNQVPGLINGLLLRQYTHVVLSGGNNEWFAQCAMQDNQIPYVELGIRIEDSYNQVLRFLPLRGSGLRALEVVEIMENFLRDESYPSEDKYAVSVYYY